MSRKTLPAATMEMVCRANLELRDFDDRLTAARRRGLVALDVLEAAANALGGLLDATWHTLAGQVDADDALDQAAVADLRAASDLARSLDVALEGQLMGDPLPLRFIVRRAIDCTARAYSALRGTDCPIVRPSGTAPQIFGQDNPGEWLSS